MQNKIERHDDRLTDQVRTVVVTYDVQKFAAASVLFEMGKTKVLCAVSMQHSVPPFMRGKGTGWLSAEYAMLPTATLVRTQRESTMMRRNGRSIEISRLIGRVLRSVIDLNSLSEYTIVVDCDVLQADGGTRTACITAASLALHCAQYYWLQSNIILKPFIHDEVAAISVGIAHNQVLVDLSYHEDSNAAADFNFIMTKSGDIIEIQGGAEKEPLSWEQFDHMRSLAQTGINQLFAQIEGLGNQEKKQQHKNFSTMKKKSIKKVPFFNLQSRQ